MSAPFKNPENPVMVEHIRRLREKVRDGTETLLSFRQGEAGLLNCLDRGVSNAEQADPDWRFYHDAYRQALMMLLEEHRIIIAEIENGTLK